MRPIKLLRLTLIAAGIAGTGSIATASNNPAMDAQVMRINNDWARIKYTVGDKGAQYRALDALAGQAAAVVARFPNQAEPLLWQGIVTSEEAAQASVFRQLGLATRARDILEHAYRIDPKAANGGIAMSLGVLYYKVPGWPIGFGNASRASELLRAALGQDPNGLDANFFYGDYLYAQGNKAGARQFLQKALRASPTPSRPVWDAGRRREVRELLAKIG
jgi:tetratricopeptide (TPR) repeat protein